MSGFLTAEEVADSKKTCDMSAAMHGIFLKRFPETPLPLDVDDVAKLIGKSPSHVYHELQSNRFPIPYWKQGSAYRFRKSDVDRYIESQMQDPAGDKADRIAQIAKEISQ